MAKTRTPKNAEMPFLDHLEELRWRIIWSVEAIAGGLVVGAAVTFESNGILDFLIKPALPYLPNGGLVYTGAMDMFGLRLKAAFAIAIVIALPVLLFQVWGFLAPGLYQRERRITLSVIFSGFVLFIAGATLAFTLIVPLGIKFLLGLGTPYLHAMITADGYFPLVIGLMLAFGVCFQLPLIILALAAMGVVDSKMLARYRRHAVVAIVLLAEALTPDVIVTTLLLAVPMYALYEISVILTRVIERRRRQAAAHSDAPASA
ncbi:MAG TPA: twin-arginine translocase subunit TatC [Gemmatimonadaceae bacterium]|nr:twin-arginine translocase subunit TatC [Gemmatimonadaceae bacterium]